MDVHTRGGLFGPGGYGGGIFDGSQMGFGATPSFEQASAGIMGLGADTGAYKWCSRTEPCPTGDPRVKALQKALNTALTAHGFKTLTVDGKCGAATCGAWGWTGTLPQSDPFFSIPGIADMLNGFVAGGTNICKSVTYPTPVGSVKPFIPPSTFKSSLPWMAISEQAGKVQGDINNDLAAHGYEPLQVSGMLDAPTCGAMQVAKNEWGMDYLTAYGGNCESFVLPRHKALPAPPPGPAPHEDETTPSLKPVKKSGMTTAWVIGGLAVAAGVAGLYAMKKR